MAENQNNQIFERPWGMFEILFESPEFKIKKITVYPDAKLSLQSHKHRSEYWIITKGSAKITKDKETLTLKKGDYIFIPQETIHRLENPTDKNAEFIEVQLGSYLGEDDIIRYEDIYHRI